jgi:hypothetical protein
MAAGAAGPRKAAALEAALRYVAGRERARRRDSPRLLSERRTQAMAWQHARHTLECIGCHAVGPNSRQRTHDGNRLPQRRRCLEPWPNQRQALIERRSWALSEALQAPAMIYGWRHPDAAADRRLQLPQAPAQAGSAAAGREWGDVVSPTSQSGGEGHAVPYRAAALRGMEEAGCSCVRVRMRQRMIGAQVQKGVGAREACVHERVMDGQSGCRRVCATVGRPCCDRRRPYV